jgi:hypothetical protein
VILIEGRELDCHGAYRLPDPLEQVEFRRCTVRTCQSPAQRTLADRPVVRNVSLVRCHIIVSTAGPVVAEDCTIDTITVHRGIWGPQILPGWAFRHVVVRGNVTGSVALLPGPGWNLGPHGPALDDPFVVANDRYYEDVDWALDISEARFTDIVLGSGIPARLIRRDPATQVVITRTALADGRWRDKADPLAFRTEIPPATGSIVDVPTHEWADGEWMTARAKRQAFARRGREHQSVDRAVRIVPHQPAQRCFIEFAIAKRRDQRQPEAAQSALKVVHGSISSRVCAGDGTTKNPVQTAGFGGIELGERSSARVDLRSPEGELFSTALRYTDL